jgi:sugar/nucleoside kinase (ribokinase family)
MKFDVVTFGSATYDNYLLSDEFLLRKSNEGVLICEMYGAKVAIKESIITTGGGATNAAVCFERMGLQSAIVGCVGRDYWGRIVRAKLREEGVSLIHIQITDKLPTSSSIFLVGEDGGRTVLVHRAASNLLTSRKVDWNRLEARWFYVSSLGGDFEILEKIIYNATKKNVFTAFNPGGSELKERERLLSFLPHINILILNKEELVELLGKKRGEKYGKDEVLALGCGLVIVTNGRDGAKAYSEEGVYQQEIIETKTVEETGAGDAFGSGFVAGQLRNLNIEQSLLLAAHNASSVVSKIGPKEGLLFWPETKKFLK